MCEGCAVAAEVVSHADFGNGVYLVTLDGFAEQLLHDGVDLRDAGGADRMPLAE